MNAKLTQAKQQVNGSMGRQGGCIFLGSRGGPLGFSVTNREFSNILLSF